MSDREKRTRLYFVEPLALPGPIVAEVAFVSDLGREPAWWPARVALTGLPLTRDQLQATTVGRTALGAWDSGNDAELTQISDRLRPEETPAHEVGRRRATSPEAKREVVDRLLSAWEARPEQRLGQLIINGYRAAYPNDIMRRGLFNVEDYGLVEIIERLPVADGSG
jgi:hypothetical protein